MDLIIFNEAQKIWQDIARDAEIETLSLELDIHKKLLNIFHVGDFYYFIFNVREAEFEYVSPEINTLLGYEPKTLKVTDFLKNIHPEDQPYFLNFENCLHHFFRKLPLDKIESYKVRYDFRIRNSKKEYVRILHQLVILQYDKSNNITRSLGIHTDISHLKNEGKPILSFIGLNGEPSYIDVKAENIFLPVKNFFSKREKEILKLMSEGKNTTEIAHSLIISKHTVATHRKNMLRKTDTHSAIDLVMKAIVEGWI